MAIDFTKSHKFVECDRVGLLFPWVWSVALSSEQIKAIASGADPRTIQPDKIVERS